MHRHGHRHGHRPDTMDADADERAALTQLQRETGRSALESEVSEDSQDEGLEGQDEGLEELITRYGADTHASGAIGCCLSSLSSLCPVCYSIAARCMPIFGCLPRRQGKLTTLLTFFFGFFCFFLLCVCGGVRLDIQVVDPKRGGSKGTGTGTGAGTVTPGRGGLAAMEKLARYAAGLSGPALQWNSFSLPARQAPPT